MKRAPSKRQCEDGKLKLRIQAIHAHSRGTYGRERVRRQLDGENVEVGKQRVARLMREIGLQGLPSKRFRRTTDSKHDRPVAPNVLGRNFEAERPNQFWVTDITFIRTWEGWLYLAVILDLFSRRVVGWAMQPVLSKNTNELKTGAPGRFDRHQPVASPRSGACRRRCRRFGFSARAGKTPSSNGMLRSLGEDLDPGPGQRWTLRRPGPHLDQNVLGQLRGSSPGLDSEPLGRPLSPPPVWPGQRPLPNLAQTWHSKIEIRDQYRK